MKLTPSISILLLTLLTIARTSIAQDDSASAITQVVRGTVLSAESHEPLIGAKVLVLGTRQGANVKTDGTFRIAGVPVGRHTIKTVALGFESISEDVIVTSGKQVVLTFELREKVVKGADVTVLGTSGFAPNNEAAISSVTSFTVDDVKRFAGSREDPARMAQNFAGVVGVNDQRNDIIIRGGSPLELLWRLDNIDIPNPNHFATEGATGGPVNAINVNLLRNSDFLTGAFPAEYGDKISGVFDLRTRKGNTEKYEFVGQLGFAGVEALTEGPIPGLENSSFIASYRKSTLQVFNALGIKFGFVGIPKYDDFTLKTDFTLGASDVLSVTGLYGTSDIALLESEQDSVFTGDFDITNGTDLSVLGINWNHIFSDKTFGELTLSLVDTKFRTRVDSLTTDFDNHVLSKDLFYVADSREGDYSAKYKLSYSADVSNVFTGGIEARIPYYNLSEYRTTVRDDPTGKPYDLSANGNSFHELSYLDWMWRPSDDLTFNTGVHFQYLGISKRSSIEPRFGARWTLGDGQSLNAGFGVHRQSQPLTIYFGNPVNSTLDFTQSLHYVLGYENKVWDDLLLKIEGYYKDIAHAPVQADSLNAFSLLNAGSNFGGVSTNKPLVSEGLGKTYGVELTLMKHFTNNYYFTATTSLFRQRFAGSDGIWRDGAFDNRYIVNLLAGYDWILTPTASIEFSGKFTVAGGAPYTPTDTVKARLYNQSGQFGPQYPDETRAFGERFPYYERLDVRVEYRKNFGSISIISFLTAENALNRKNVLLYGYDPRTHSITQVNQLGVFPYGGFRIEF